MRFFSPNTVNSIIIIFIFLNMGLISLYFYYEPGESLFKTNHNREYLNSQSLAKKDIQLKLQEIVKEKNLEKTLLNVVNRDILMKEMKVFLKNPMSQTDSPGDNSKKIDLIFSIFKTINLSEHDKNLRKIILTEQSTELKNLESEIFYYILLKLNNYNIPFSKVFLDYFENKLLQDKENIISLIFKKNEILQKEISREYYIEEYILLKLSLETNKKTNISNENSLNIFFNFILKGLQLNPNQYEDFKEVFKNSIYDFTSLLKRYEKNPEAPYQNLLKHSTSLYPKIDLTKIMIESFPEKKEALLKILKKSDSPLYEIIHERF